MDVSVENGCHGWSRGSRLGTWTSVSVSEARCSVESAADDCSTVQKNTETLERSCSLIFDTEMEAVDDTGLSPGPSRSL